MKARNGYLNGQVHKSYAINLEKLKGVTGNRILLSNGTEIPLGRGYRKALKGWVGE